jgi:hypothetical protein
MRTCLVVSMLTLMVVTVGCPGDRDASGGPYVEISPGTELDFGEVDNDTLIEEIITIQNVGPRLWEMELNDASIATGVDFYCLDGDDEDCLLVDQYEQRDWMLEIRTYCGDNGNTNIRLFFNDPESVGTSVEHMEDITLAISWTTLKNGVPCSDD